MDLNYTRDTTSGQEGLEVIPRIQALDNTLPIMVMTAWATIDLAVHPSRSAARAFESHPESLTPNRDLQSAHDILRSHSLGFNGRPVERWTQDAKRSRRSPPLT